MQNLSMVAFLFLEMRRVTKFNSEGGNKSSNSDSYPRKMGLTLK